MATYVYCGRGSNGAAELVKALGALRLRKFDGMNFWDKRRKKVINDGDIVVCWGATIPELDGVRIINSRQHQLDKYDELQAFKVGGIPTLTTMKASKYAPDVYKKAGFVGRSANHQGGTDLLMGCRYPDYFVSHENFTQEFRIHSFLGRSIRAGQKILRDGFTLAKDEKLWRANASLAHPWVRSYDGGWRINYDGFSSTKELRNLAHKAVKAIGLVFGAVDIAKTSDGVLKVLEVNSAPGLEGGSIAAYVKAITKWIKDPKNMPTGPEGD